MALSLALAGLIGAGISAGAGLIGNGLNWWNNERNNRLQMEREDSAIQRRVEDLKKAGLNPLLSAGQGASAGGLQATTFDTSQAGNFVQNLFNLKNNRELYKQNQLYTRLLENQVSTSNMDLYLSRINAYNTLGVGGYNSLKYDAFGNVKDNTANVMHFHEDSDLFNSYKNMLRNSAKENYRQSLFDLKSQNYRNYLNLVNDSLEPLLTIGDIVGSAGKTYRLFRGNENFNFSNINGNWRSDTTSHNYNYNYNSGRR